MGNIFGHIYRLTTFGESHGDAIGGVIDGVPAGIDIDIKLIQKELARRRPGQSAITTTRKEPDSVELLSGIYEGKTTGCPIGFIVRNVGHHSDDYSDLQDVFRPSHADYVYYAKYGIRDHRGGGRSSARVTLSRCVGGAVAKMCLSKVGVSVSAYTSQVGNVCVNNDYKTLDLTLTETNAVRCPDQAKAAAMEQLIREVRDEGDTIGGTVTCVVKGCPPGLGEPEFDKLHAALGAAMLGINAAKGIEFGAGFSSASQRGSQLNDIFASDNKGGITTLTNNSGGIQGGISNGQDIYFRVVFKPVATLLREQQTVDIHGNAAVVRVKGRHDPCVVPRAVPIVEAMAAMTILDYYLMARCSRM